MTILVFAAAILPGFLLPGYVVSRIALSRCLLVSTFVFSVLTLFQDAFWLQVAPWHLRTWVLTGDPFRSNAVGSLFPVRPRCLERQPFYDIDRVAWHPVRAVEDWILYRIPEPS